jgi:hypothetical protein
MYLNDDQIIVLGFKSKEQGQFEVLNGICKGGPNFVMRLEMIAKRASIDMRKGLYAWPRGSRLLI